MPGSIVECYSGHTYAQEPRALIWQGQRCAVAHVEQRWRTPDGPGFLVRTDAGRLFQLHYRELDDSWLVQALSDDASTPDRAPSTTWLKTPVTDPQRAPDDHPEEQGDP